MQILYNKLTQARLPATTAKPGNSQIFFGGGQQQFHTSHRKESAKKKKNLGSNIFGFWEQYTFCVHDITLPAWASETYIPCVFKLYKYIYIYEQKCTKTNFIQEKRINAKWKLMILNFNNLKKIKEKEFKKGNTFILFQEHEP